jgi:hypothetical protein
VNEQEYQALLSAIDRALGQFQEPPEEPGFDRDIYEELRRVRETIIRSHRDRRDPGIRRDSKSPLGSA